MAGEWKDQPWHATRAVFPPRASPVRQYAVSMIQVNMPQREEKPKAGAPPLDAQNGGPRPEKMLIF